MNGLYCVGVELLSPNSEGEAISAPSSVNLLDGVVHHVEVNVHLLYHYLDDQDVPVFALDSVLLSFFS